MVRRFGKFFGVLCSFFLTRSILGLEASNTFFLQFPNCLAYETLEECAEKLAWALRNEPTPLTEDYRHRFTWEGANERLYEAGGITKREMRDRVKSGAEKADTEVAWFHVENMKKGKSLTSFFAGLKNGTSAETPSPM
jgi:hypothetical protein